MQKSKYIYANIEAILSNKIVIVFLSIALIVFGYFCSTINTSKDYFTALVEALTYQQFITLCFLPMIVLFDVLIINLFDKNYMLIMRLNDAKKYYKEMIKSVIFGNTFIFIMMLLAILTFLNFFFNGSLTIKYVDFFKTTNLIYAIYVAMKLYILSIVVSIFFLFMYKLFDKIVCTIITFLFISSLFACQWFQTGVVNNIFKIPYYFGVYFLDIVEYKTFFINILSFFIITILMFCLLYIIYIISIKKTGDVRC